MQGWYLYDFGEQEWRLPRASGGQGVVCGLVDFGLDELFYLKLS
jgi:hypothetical protein